MDCSDFIGVILKTVDLVASFEFLILVIMCLMSQGLQMYQHVTISLRKSAGMIECRIIRLESQQHSPDLIEDMFLFEFLHVNWYH